MGPGSSPRCWAPAPRLWSWCSPTSLGSERSGSQRGPHCGRELEGSSLGLWAGGSRPYLLKLGAGLPTHGGRGGGASFCSSAQPFFANSISELPPPPPPSSPAPSLPLPDRWDAENSSGRTLAHLATVRKRKGEYAALDPGATLGRSPGRSLGREEASALGSRRHRVASSVQASQACPYPHPRSAGPFFCSFSFRKPRCAAERRHSRAGEARANTPLTLCTEGSYEKP